MSSQMSNISATAFTCSESAFTCSESAFTCSESACICFESACTCPLPTAKKSCSILLPTVLINQILTYIAELNGVTWFQLLNQLNDAQYTVLNQLAPSLDSIYRSIAHKSCNYPAPITVGINGRYIEGTIRCLSVKLEYADVVFGEPGEVCEIFRSVELIEYEEDGESEYVVLNGIYSRDTDFELHDSSLLHIKNPEQIAIVGLPVISAVFQDRDIIDLEVEYYDDVEEADYFEGFGDEEFGGIAWDEPNNGGMGW